MFQFAQLWCDFISWIPKFQVLYRKVVFVAPQVHMGIVRFHSEKDMLNNLDLMHIEKNDQIIFDDVVRISGK